LQPIVAPFCVRCGIPFDPLAHSANECADCRSNRYHGAPPFDALRSAFTFTGAMRPAVHRLKYNGKTALAVPLAVVLNELLQNNALPNNDLKLICPVPLHPWRRWRRGYNQSALLAANLSRFCGVPYGEVLYRTRRTPPQVGLNEKQRLANVKDAFAVQQRALQLLNPTQGAVLLIDDVCTTGATIAECARILRKAGITQVYALTLARQL
jgi:ComF family protein